LSPASLKENEKMHDPMSVAFEFHYPWYQHKPWPKKAKTWEGVKNKRGRSQCWREGYRDTWLTIWHVDPERDGSDDSCGWFHPPFTDRQQEIINRLAWAEAQQPWLRGVCAKSLDNPMMAESLCRAGLLQTADAFGMPLSIDTATRMAIRLVHNQLDNIRGSLCLMPGYHTNHETDDNYWREETARGLYRCFARAILHQRRRWWQSPRWHIHHWKIQCHPWQKLRRWLFERCSSCGKGYSWGYCPTSDWNGIKTWHSDCNNPHSNCAGEAKAN
jgi:hypothetical protein